MSTRMPVLKKIISGADARTQGGVIPNEMLRVFVEPCTFMDIQVAQDIRESQCQKNGDGFLWDSSTQLGPIKPPFPNVWMEWSMPTNEPSGPDLVMEIACSVEEYDDGSLNLILVFIGPSKHGSPLVASLFKTFQLTLNTNGTLFKMEQQIHDSEDGKVTKTEPVEADHQLVNVLITPLTALSLINCKNVKTEETGRVTSRRSASEKRRGIPAHKIKYHTIQLPGGGTQSDGKGGHRAAAIHRVRGHFKTFTSERPLLGQHVGTYWWGWQVRGKAEKGIVVSDYNLEGAAK